MLLSLCCYLSSPHWKRLSVTKDSKLYIPGPVFHSSIARMAIIKCKYAFVISLLELKSPAVLDNVQSHELALLIDYLSPVESHHWLRPRPEWDLSSTSTFATSTFFSLSLEGLFSFTVLIYPCLSEKVSSETTHYFLSQKLPSILHNLKALRSGK